MYSFYELNNEKKNFWICILHTESKNVEILQQKMEYFDNFKVLTALDINTETVNLRDSKRAKYTKLLK